MRPTNAPPVWAANGEAARGSILPNNIRLCANESMQVARARVIDTIEAAPLPVAARSLIPVGYGRAGTSCVETSHATERPSPHRIVGLNLHPVRGNPQQVPFVPIVSVRSGANDHLAMGVTVFFGNGQLGEFPTAVGVEKCEDGFVHVLRYGPQPPALESMVAFNATDVAFAQVYDYGGVLTAVITGDRPAAASSSSRGSALQSFTRS